MNPIKPYTAEHGYNPRHIDAGGRIALYIDPGLEAVRIAFMSPLLMEHGEVFLNQPFPKGYRAASPTTRCYDAAMHLAVTSGLIYCEGMAAITHPETGVQTAIAHGWCCDPEGRVVDPTLSHLQHRSQIRYLGVRISTMYHLAWESAMGYFGLLDGHQQLGKEVGIYSDPPSLWKLS